MNLTATLMTAFKALLRNPTRAMLTTLGIVIGIAAVITMMEIGSGSSNSIRDSIEKMGANSVMVIPGADRRGGISKGTGSQMSLTPEDCEAINKECPAVALAVPVVSANGKQVISGNSNYQPTQIQGSSPGFLTIRNWVITKAERSRRGKSTTGRASVWSERQWSASFSRGSRPSTTRSASRIPRSASSGPFRQKGQT